jgi:hypothetical protein
MPFDPDAPEANVIRFRINQQAAWDLFLKTDKELGPWYQAAQQAVSNLKTLPLDLYHWRADFRASLVDAVRSNIDALANGVTSQRYQAALNLQRLGPLASPATGALKNALKDEDADVRDAAARALGTAEALQTARRGRSIDELSNEDVKKRIAAAGALVEDRFITPATGKTLAQTMKGDAIGRMGIARGLERAWRDQISLDQALAKIMRDAKDPMARLTTAIAMKILAAGNADPNVYQAERATIIDELKHRLASGHSSARLLALRTLRQLDVNPAELADALSAAALADDRELRHEASQQLLAAGKAGQAGWLAMFEDPRREVKGLALAEAVQIGAGALPAQKAIVKLTKDSDATLRRMAATALGSLGPASKERLDALLNLFADSDPDVREEALIAARRLAPNDPRVLSGLYQMMQDPDPLLSAWARGQVREIKMRERNSATANAVELLEQLRSKDPATRLQAARAMKQEHVLPQRVEAALLKAVEDRDFAAREGLVMAIEEAWKSHVEVATALKQLEKEPKQRAYARAAERALESVDKPP